MGGIDSIDPHCAWTISRQHEHLRAQCQFIISLCAMVKPCEPGSELLCHKCGVMYCDPIIHIIATCSSIMPIRHELWSEIINIGPIEFSVVLHNMDDTYLALNLLSCKSDRFFDLSNEDAEKFGIVCVTYIYKMCKTFDSH